MRAPRNALAWGGVMLLPAFGAALYGFARSAFFRRDTGGGTLDGFGLRSSEQRRPRTRPAAAPKRSSTVRKSAKGNGKRHRASPSLPAVPDEQLAFHARLGNVLDVVVGVHANADDADVDVRGIEAHTELRMRPTDLEALVARAAALLERERRN
jgi:hypothetical protein